MRRIGLGLPLAAFLTLLASLVPVAEAAAPPNFASTPQYLAFVEYVKKLDAKRDGQLAYLGAKLEKGRADVASMPASG